MKYISIHFTIVCIEPTTQYHNVAFYIYSLYVNCFYVTLCVLYKCVLCIFK